MFTRSTLTLFGMACVFDVSHINIDVFSPFISKTTQIRRVLLRYRPGYENRFQKTRNRPVHARPRELMFSCSRFYTKDACLLQSYPRLSYRSSSSIMFAGSHLYMCN